MLGLSELTIVGEGEPASISECGLPEAVISLLRAHGEKAAGLWDRELEPRTDFAPTVDVT